DPISFAREFADDIESATTHWVLVSKSGSTIETLTTAGVLLDIIKNPRDRFTVVTEPKPNALRNWAEAHSVSCLEIPVDVGGRFSVFSSAGLLPLAFADRNFD